MRKERRTGGDDDDDQNPCADDDDDVEVEESGRPSSIGMHLHYEKSVSQKSCCCCESSEPKERMTSLNRKVVGVLFALLWSVSDAKSWFGGGSTSSADVPAACSPPCVPGDESIMRPKEHGTSHTPVQSKLRWSCSTKIADQICNFNRHYAERSGYWLSKSTFLEEVDTSDGAKPVTFYDSNTGKPLFRAPLGRSWKDFLNESRHHGWPSFRDPEVVWENVRVLPGGETVSVDGTHLGHNLPSDGRRRYCINLVSIAGFPTKSDELRD